MITFRAASELWLAEQQNRKLRPKSLHTYRSILRVHLAERFGDMNMADLVVTNNKTMRTLVADLTKTYKPASIRLMLSVFRGVLESITDDNGNRVYRPDWNWDYIGAPTVNPLEQHAPMITAEEVNAIVIGRKDSLLYATLAGTGLRIGELLALTADDWDRQAAIFRIRVSKTPAGVREVDLPMALNDHLRAAVGDRQGRLFPDWPTTYRRRAAGITGFAHSFRRFRLTHLRRAGVNEDIVKLWMGHADKTISDRYSRLRLDREFRRDQCRLAGLGFELRTGSTDQSSTLVPLRGQLLAGKL